MSLIVCLRSVFLIVLPFIPPIEVHHFKASALHPNGYQDWKFYLNDELLTLVYTLNALYCFFSLIYGGSCYYNWIIAQLHMATVQIPALKSLKKSKITALLQP